MCDNGKKEQERSRYDQVGPARDMTEAEYQNRETVRRLRNQQHELIKQLSKIEIAIGVIEGI